MITTWLADENYTINALTITYPTLIYRLGIPNALKLTSFLVRFKFTFVKKDQITQAA